MMEQNFKIKYIRYIQADRRTYIHTYLHKTNRQPHIQMSDNYRTNNNEQKFSKADKIMQNNKTSTV